MLKLPPDSRYEVTQTQFGIWLAMWASQYSLQTHLGKYPTPGYFDCDLAKSKVSGEKVAFRITNSSFSKLLICISQLEHHLKMPHWYHQRRNWIVWYNPQLLVILRSFFSDAPCVSHVSSFRCIAWHCIAILTDLRRYLCSVLHIFSVHHLASIILWPWGLNFPLYAYCMTSGLCR